MTKSQLSCKVKEFPETDSLRNLTDPFSNICRAEFEPIQIEPLISKQIICEIVIY